MITAIARPIGTMEKEKVSEINAVRIIPIMVITENNIHTSAVLMIFPGLELILIIISP